MNMELSRLHKIQILALLTLACLIGLSMFRLTTVLAEDKPDQSALKSDTTQDNDADSEKSEKASDAKNQADESSLESDPNTVSSEDDSDNDIFDVKLSSLVLINEAYDRIFTPDLITEKGGVKYSTLKRKHLDALAATRELKQLNPAVLMSLSKGERIAFWINTYNFCTIELILRHYPIQPKWYMIIYPDNSIMQITGAWEKEFFDIQREEYNLREIEQDFLLKRYQDPRICFALSNASVGGATLRNEPYRADRLDEQLNDQVKKYLAQEKGMRLDKEKNILYLSNIFQVNKDTFLASEYAAIKKFRNRKDEERAWLNFVVPYLSEEDVRYLETTQFSIKFIDVDWHLNEAK